MTPREQAMFNEVSDRLKAIEWRDRVVLKLNHKLDPLGASDKIALLRKVEELL